MLERVVEVPATVVPMSELGIYYYNTEWKILILKRTNIGHRELWRITVHDAGTTCYGKRFLPRFMGRFGWQLVLFFPCVAAFLEELQVAITVCCSIDRARNVSPGQP